MSVEEDRWRQLTRMTMAQLRAEYARVQREHNLTTVMGGPRTREEIANAIVGIERTERIRSEHAAEFGAGHERCPMVNFAPKCRAEVTG